MKKYKALCFIGGVLIYGGAILFLISLAADPDIPIPVFLKMFCGAILSIVVGCLLCYWEEVEGVLLASLITVSAWLYQMNEGGTKWMKQCYSYRCKCSSYTETFAKCRARYYQYNDHKYHH